MTFIKQRRTISKLLTILFRDFAKLATTDEERLKNLSRVSWGLSFNSLVYLGPFYQERVLFATEEQRQSAELNDTDIEFHSCIAQILSLMSTIWMPVFGDRRQAGLE